MPVINGNPRSLDLPRFFIFSIFILLGIGRNLPGEILHFSGVGIVDLIVTSYSLISLLRCTSGTLQKDVIAYNRPYLHGLVFIFSWGFLSLVFNAFLYGFELKDVFELFKYLYLLLLIHFVSSVTLHYGINIALGFPFGVVLSSIVAIQNPMNPDVLGIPQMFNPNVIGNCIGTSIFMCSMISLRGNKAFSGIMAFSLLMLSFFTYSKSAWIISLTAIAAFSLSFTSSFAKISAVYKWVQLILFSLLVVVVLTIVIQNYDLIYTIVNAKIQATQFASTAVEGGSAAARFGLMLSAFYMFLSNPLLGVGISNYEIVNQRLRSDLGSLFYPDDNANSAFFYILGGMGLPAFAVFCYIFYVFSSRLARISGFVGLRANTFVFFGLLVFFLGGNVQVEMLTAYYFWVSIGLSTSLVIASDLDCSGSSATSISVS